RFSISLSEPSQFCALVGFLACPTPVSVEACSFSHALLHSAAHGRKLGPTAGALPVSARFIPRLVKERCRCSGWRGVLRCWVKYRHTCNACQQANLYFYR